MSLAIAARGREWRESNAVLSFLKFRALLLDWHCTGCSLLAFGTERLAPQGTMKLTRLLAQLQQHLLRYVLETSIQDSKFSPSWSSTPCLILRSNNSTTELIVKEKERRGSALRFYQFNVQRHQAELWHGVAICNCSGTPAMLCCSSDDLRC
jgi:hypothetical protein